MAREKQDKVGRKSKCSSLMQSLDMSIIACPSEKCISKTTNHQANHFYAGFEDTFRGPEVGKNRPTTGKVEETYPSLRPKMLVRRQRKNKQLAWEKGQET